MTTETLKLNQALEKDPTLLDIFVDARLKDMFTALYSYRYLGTDDLNEFRDWLGRYLYRYEAKYLKLLEAYNTDIDWRDGEVDTETRADTSKTDYGHIVATEGHAQGNTLPNKKVVSSATNTFATNTSDDTSRQTNDGSDTYNGSGTTTRKHGDKIDLRTKYYESIRNIYYEWASEFEPLFDLLD